MASPTPASGTLLVVADRVYGGAPQEHVPGEAEAVWIRDGRVHAVGPARALRAAARGAPVLALPGTTITPGFADAHLHLTEWAFARREADLSTAHDPEQAAAMLAQREHAGDGWIRGRGWNPHLWHGVEPSKDLLDRHFPDRPVALQSHDMHALWANGAALERAGIDAHTRDPVDGRIVRDETGAPTGLLLENAAALVTGCIPAPTLDDGIAAVRDAQAELHALGITAVHSFPGVHTPLPDPLAIVEVLRARDELRLRVLHHISLDALDGAIRIGLRSGFGGEWIRIGGVKMFLDGALGSRTAWMRAPYEGEAQCGIRMLEPDEFVDTVARAAAAGIASTVHAIGDAAVALAIDVLARPALRVAALPHRIEHVQCCPPDLLRALAGARVTCSVQPAHLITDWRAADLHWGERGRWTYAFRSLLDHGALLAFGSDAPVEPVDPRLGLHAAISRTDLEGAPQGGWYDAECITAVDALRAYTAGPAAAAAATGFLGTLAPGAAGDLVAWDRDPLALDGADARDMRCRATVVAGELVHSLPPH